MEDERSLLRWLSVFERSANADRSAKNLQLVLPAAKRARAARPVHVGRTRRRVRRGRRLVEL